PGLPHELGDEVHAALMPARDQLGVDARAPVAALHPGVNRRDLRGQFRAPNLGGAGLPFAPGVVARARYPQRAAHLRHGPFRPAFLDPGEDQFVWLAKNAVAFFRMSRSASRRLTSARSLRFSSSSGVSCPDPGNALAPSLRTAFFQVWSRF